jgi:hypothetical protein
LFALAILSVKKAVDFIMYEFAKDFASPIVTFIAAGIAGYITFTFARIQAGIATSQRDIALDKLKFDLFHNRYEIYENVKKLIEYVFFVVDTEKIDFVKIRSFYVKMDEARFYFPSDICTVLDGLKKRCEMFFQHLAERERVNLDDRVEWSRLANILGDHQADFSKTYASLPQIFENTLAFKQLTGHPNN